MRSRIGFIAALGAAILLAACGQGGGAASGKAETPEEVAAFYRGKTIAITVGFSASGGYDGAARLVARHMGQFIPGKPRIIVQNMPGAGSLLAANYMFNAAPKDGTALGVLADTTPLMPLWKQPGAKFEPVAIEWVGALTSRPTPLLIVRTDAPATTVEAARTKEITIGATGPDSSTAAYPKLLNEVAGTKVKPILGYEGGTEIMLAIERGEVHGRGGYDWETLKRERGDWLKSGFITPMVQMALKPNPELPNVPIATSFAKTPQDLQLLELVFGSQQFSRAFTAPPGTPPARLAALQAAFDAMVKDPAFLEDARRSMPEPLDISPGTEIKAYVKGVAATPQPVLDRAAHFIGHE